VRHFATEVQNSFLVNMEQKLSKSANNCNSWCKRFTATFLWTTV